MRKIDGERATLELLRDYRNERHSVWGITARNREQNFALNLLMDPEIDFVTVLGPAGTGKTLLALAAGLMQTLETNRFVEIIMTRVTIPLGEDIGFLPGTEEEKMEPWMGALMDNLEVLTQSQEGGNWGRAATNDLLRNRIKIRSLNFMRGRTFLNRFIILDEAQNLTPKQMKALVTRAGPGTKLVCLGNIAQIDTPYLTEMTSGLTYVGQSLPRLAALRPHHADARRALAAGGLRLGHPVGSGNRARKRCGRTAGHSRGQHVEDRRIAGRVACTRAVTGLRSAQCCGVLLACVRAGGRAATRSSDLPDIGNPAGALVTQSDEYRLGAQIVRSLRDQNAIIDDPEVTEYLQALGSRLAAQAPDGNQHVHVLRRARRHHQRVRPARRLHRRELRHGARDPQRIGARGRDGARNRARHAAAHRAHHPGAGPAEHRADGGDPRGDPHRRHGRWRRRCHAGRHRHRAGRGGSAAGELHARATNTKRIASASASSPARASIRLAWPTLLRDDVAPRRARRHSTSRR